MKILAIETSCDESSIAYTDGGKLLGSKTYSQIKHHTQYQGVHPSVARRAHEIRLPILLADLTKKISVTSLLSNLDALAVTVGPGLPPALQEGIKFAKKLALDNSLPLIPVNHLEGHLASIFVKRSTGSYFTRGADSLITSNNTWLNLIVSGGHTELVQTFFDVKSNIYSHRLIGQTLDDAAGEVLDKVGRELGLGYPAGPALEMIAQAGDPNAIQFPLPLKNTPKDDLNFSFSGLKTKAVQILMGNHQIGTFTKRLERPTLTDDMPNFAASFQQAVINAILFKVKRAVLHTGIRSLTLSGGVSANQALRNQLRKVMKDLKGELYLSNKKFTGDNAAMIACAANWAYNRDEVCRAKEEIEHIDRLPDLNF